MKVREIIDKIERKAPLKISQDIIAKGGYDNSGLIVGDFNAEVSGVVIAIDLSDEALALAKKKNASLIITHHPAIYGGISTITADSMKGRQLIEAIRSGISVYSSHLCMDMTEGGIDDTVAKALGIEVEKAYEVGEGYSYGKLGKVPFKTLGEFVENAKTHFAFVHYLGELDKEISTACSLCGGGTDFGAMGFAISNNADVYVSCDMKHHERMELFENGVAVVELAHGESEFYAFKKIIKNLDLEAPVYVCETDFKMI